MQLFGIRTDLIHPGDKLIQKIMKSIGEQRLQIDDGDILAVASKALATSQKRLVRLSSVKASLKAEELAGKYDLESGFVEIVLKEADRVYGGVPKALLTLKEHILTANAGVDHKNSPKGYVTLWPKAPFKTAKEIQKELLAHTGKHFGVLIVDSRVTPLRMGTTGLAIGFAGFQPVKDCRGKKDLYRNEILVTRHAIADDLAGACHLIMGESNEQTPAVLIKSAPVILSEKVKPSSVVIHPKSCLYARYILPE